MPASIFEVPETYSGKSLGQIADLTGVRPRLDILSGQLGVREDQPLTTGQRLSFSSDDPGYLGSGEYQALIKYFGNPLSTQDIASREQATALKARQQAIAPAVSSLEASIPEISQKFGSEKTRLEAGKAPLKARYQSILDELKRREGVETQETNTALAREFGRRGIPLSSGLYDETGIEKRRPISEFYSGQTKDVGLSQEAGLSNIDTLISNLTGAEVETIRAVRNTLGQLQAGAGEGAIQDAFNMLQMQAQQRQFDEGQTLERERLRFAEQGRATEEAMSQRNFAEQVRQFNESQAEQQRQFGLNFGLESSREKRLGTPGAKSPTKLQFNTVTDSRGNQTVVALDPFSGKVVATSNPIQQSTSGINALQKQSGGFDLGQTIKNAWSWFNNP